MAVWLYKGKEAKIFDEAEVKKAEKDGWFDCPTKAEKALKEEAEAKKEEDKEEKAKKDK